MNLDDLPAGEHQVRIIKEGYLENSHVVMLESGTNETMEMTLTAADTTQPVVENEGGGSRLPLILAAVVGGVAVAVAGVSASGNQPPRGGTFTVGPLEVGVESVTPFMFTATGASDPDGDSLTFMWDFGDGVSGSGQTTTHVYTNSGIFTVTLTVSDGQQSTTAAPGSVTVANLNGTWVSVRRGTIRTWRLTQTGTSISGTYTQSRRAGGGVVNGELGLPRNLVVTAKLDCCNAFTFSATINSTVRQLSGFAAGSNIDDDLVFNKQ